MSRIPSLNVEIAPLNASLEERKSSNTTLKAHFSRLGILQHHYVHDHLSDGVIFLGLFTHRDN